MNCGAFWFAFFVTPSGFLSCIDIQYVEYFVDRIVDVKAKSWVNFTRVYSGKSGFTKVGEKLGVDLKNLEVKADEVEQICEHTTLTK